MALIMSLDPLTHRFCLFIFFSPSHTNFVVVKKRPYRSADIDGLLACSCQSINQSEKVLNSNRDLIIRVFKSLIVAFTFTSHKPFDGYFVTFGELL